MKTRTFSPVKGKINPAKDISRTKSFIPIFSFPNSNVLVQPVIFHLVSYFVLQTTIVFFLRKKNQKHKNRRRGCGWGAQNLIFLRLGIYTKRKKGKERQNPTSLNPPAQQLHIKLRHVTSSPAPLSPVVSLPSPSANITSAKQDSCIFKKNESGREIRIVPQSCSSAHCSSSLPPTPLQPSKSRWLTALLLRKSTNACARGNSSSRLIDG